MSPHIYKYPETSIGRANDPVYVTRIECAISASGACDVDSTFINGEILKLYYDKGTVTSATTATVTFENEVLNTYDISSGSAHRYPRVETLLIPFVVSGLINVAVTGGQAGKAFDVYVFSR